MSLAAIFTASVILIAFATVFFTKIAVEKVFALAFVTLLVSTVLPSEQAFLALANPGVISLACLYVIVGSLQKTGAMQLLVQNILSKPKTSSSANVRLLPPVAFASAFFNNTPIVAALTPGLVDWCKRVKVSPTKILLPLSYAAILGGTCTIIGTSTNLVVYGLLSSQFPEQEFGFFELAKIGLPITILGLLYILFFSNKVLPKRTVVDKDFQDVRQYTFEMLIDPQGSLVGKTVEQAGLRGLDGVYLICVGRGCEKFGNVSSETVLQASDRLIFSGSISSLTDMLSINGLQHSDEQVYKLEDTNDTKIVEALIGKSIRSANFRKNYQAVVIAVIRSGERIDKKNGDIVINAGDILLLQATQNFIQNYRHTNEFLLLQGAKNIILPRKEKVLFAVLGLLSIIVLSALNIFNIVTAACLGVTIVLISQTITIQQALKSIDYKILAVIFFAIGFGEAVQSSGLAQQLGIVFSSFEFAGPVSLLIATYLLTFLLTEFVTNNASAIISFSIISSLVVELQLNIVPFAVAIMIAASASFITPFGYQTNLIVYTAGNYAYKDFIKFGLPLSLMTMVLSILLISNFWSLTI